MENFQFKEYEIFDPHDLTRAEIKFLRKKGWLITGTKNSIYNPQHWQDIHGGIFNFEKDECIDPGDFWYYEDAFKALTPEAKAWCEGE